MSKLVVYKASAGSGKTFRLSAEYIKMVVVDPLSYKKILAVTFTNKATAEMKERILFELYNLANGKESGMLDVIIAETGFTKDSIKFKAKEALSNILHDYSMFSVSTIDSFVQRVIQNLLWEIGFHGNNELRLEYESIVEKAVDRLLDSSAEDMELFERFQSMIYEQLEEDKSPDIRKMLVSLGMNLYSEQFRLLTKEQMTLMGSKELINAVADYSLAKIEEIADGICSRGKVLVDDIAKNGFSVDDFSNKNSGVYGFIVKCSRFKAYTEIIEIGSRTRDALETPDGEGWVSKDFIKKNPGRAGLLLEHIANGYHSQLFEIVQYMESNQTEYNTAISVSKNLDTLTVFNDIREKVKEILSEENAMILADSGPLLREFIKGNDAPFVYEKIGTRYDCFMLDEFQDTSVIQWHNFKPLIGNSLAQDEFSMVVGDVKQAIYRWRNSDWRILANQIEDDFAVDIRNLTKNHRSQYQIVEFNNNFFTKTSKFLIDWTKSLCGESISPELLELVTKAYENPTQDCKYTDKNSGFVEVTHISTDKDELEDELLLQKFEKLIPEAVNRGYRIGDIAILVRKKSEGKRIADILLSLKNKYPEQAQLFNVVSQDALQLSASHAIKLCIAAMKLILNSADSLSAAILSKEIMVVGEQTISWEFTFLNFDISTEKQWLVGLRNLPLVSMYESILQRYSLQSITKELPYLAVLHEQIIEISRVGAASLPYFVEWWEDKKGNLALSMPESSDAINIMTIHKSKGLQFPIVIVPYANIDIFKQDSRKLLWLSAENKPYSNYPLYPISYSKNLLDSDFKGNYLVEKVQTMVDSLNLLYVAFTRPENELYVFVSAPKIIDDAKNTADIVIPPLSQMNAVVTENTENSVEIKEYTFGKHVRREEAISSKNDSETEVWIMENYSVNTKSLNIAQQLEASEFFRESESSIIAGMEYGKLMHRLFSLIITVSDVENALYLLNNEGIITENQVQPLKQNVNKILEKQPFSDWFSGTWNVKTESEILTVEAAIYRPDRIMIRDNQAIVVDYKFGDQLPKHQTQVQNYMQLIKSMNYTDVKGFIWYVDNGNLVEVNGF